MHSQPKCAECSFFEQRHANHLATLGYKHVIVKYDRKDGREMKIISQSYLLFFLLFFVGDTPNFSDFRFVVEPRDTIAVKGTSTSLDCVAKGRPPPKIEWKREGKILQFIGDSRRSVLPNGSLYFSSVYHTRTERPDEGLYQCLATIKELGTIVSRTAKLQVASLPRFDEQPQDVTLYSGQAAYLPCAIQGIPPASVSWEKDSYPLQIDSSRMIVLPSGALEIKHVKITDEGRYRCNASNVDKYRVSAEGSLSVKPEDADSYKRKSPEFITTPKSVTVIEGTNVALDCAGNGNPHPQITWLKDGGTIDLK
ncbi:neogenin-like [Tachypleus tridentatus]|uniref:neogenin-like n=1 Tax=Tachypleus tridentatus TaxID=6853 RepID=UPI003FD5267D